MAEFDIHGFMVDTEEESLMQIDVCHGQCVKTTEYDDNYNPLILSTSEIYRKIKKGNVCASLRKKLWMNILKPTEVKMANKEKFDYHVFKNDFKNQLPHETLPDLISKLNDITRKQEDIACDDNTTTTDSFITLRQISIDIDRTFPNHIMFQSGTQHQLSLFYILAAYSQYNASVGYCQGMAYIVALILMYIQDNEEGVFWCLVSLLESHDHLHSFYNKDLQKIKLLSETFTILVNKEYPELGKHFMELGVESLTYTTNWFMTLFTSLNCWDTILLIVDIFFLEGVHQLLNAGLSIMKLCLPELLVMNTLGEVLPFIQNIPARLIHRESVKSLLMSHPVLANISDMEMYMLQAEESLTCKEIEFKDSRENYYHQINNRKRKHDMTTTDTPGLWTRLINTFTPISKKVKQDEQDSLSNARVPKSMLKSTSTKSGKFSFTPESGLIYTSPNTIEMKSLKSTSKYLQFQEIKKLQFDSPDTSGRSPLTESPLLVHVKNKPHRRSPRIAKRKLDKNTTKI